MFPFLKPTTWWFRHFNFFFVYKKLKTTERNGQLQKIYSENQVLIVEGTSYVHEMHSSHQPGWFQSPWKAHTLDFSSPVFRFRIATIKLFHIIQIISQAIKYVNSMFLSTCQWTVLSTVMFTVVILSRGLNQNEHSFSLQIWVFPHHQPLYSDRVGCGSLFFPFLCTFD